MMANPEAARSEQDVKLETRSGANLSGLIWTLVRTDFKTRYHGTFGGYLWALLKPAALFIVLFGVFSVVFSMDPNYNLNLVIGLFYWDFFAEATRSGMGSLHGKAFLLTRAQLPASIIVLTASSNAVVTLWLFSALIWIYIAVAHHSLHVGQIALLALYNLIYLGIVSGLSLASSVLYLRYRDLNQVWDLALQAGFFVAPVVYPLNIIPERYHFYLYVWPPTPVLQFTRSILVQGELPTLRAHLMLLGTCLAILLVGVAVYRRFAPRALEEL
jgi:lipopolysaccharide transport system permease protein